jgi:hypothetical protein
MFFIFVEHQKAFYKIRNVCLVIDFLNFFIHICDWLVVKHPETVADAGR